MNFLEGLALLFIALKLTNFVDWSWWVVLMPLYPITLCLSLMILAWLVVGDSKSVITALNRIID